MVEPVRIAVVGAGFMGELHARTIAESDTAELAAVVDLDPEVGTTVAGRYGTRHTTDLRELLDGDADAFVVALPDRAHVDVACQILFAGKPALVEKPLADNLEGARRIASAASEGSTRVMVGHVLRFDPRYVAAAEAVANGDIGDPVHVQAGRFTLRDVGQRMNGSSSVCFYLGVHDVDAAQWISGRRITRVYSRAASKLMPSLGVQSEDAILSVCEFEDGTVGQLHFGWSLPSNAPTGINARLHLVGTKGVIDLDVTDQGLAMLTDGYAYPDALHWPEANGRIMGDLAEEVRHFAVSVRDGKDFVVGVDDALRAVAVNDAILRSVESGRPEDVEPVTR